MSEKDIISAELDAALAKYAASPIVIAALDFDGTLAELRDDPQAVRPTDAAAKALAAISDSPGVTVALVSGRPAGDLGRLATPPLGTVLIGSHGAEIGEYTNDGEVVLLDVGITQHELDRRDKIAAELERIVKDREGAWVEYKPLAVVLHTRMAAPDDARAATEEALAGPATWDGVHALKGKDVVELPVRDATKGDAVRHLRASVSEGTDAPVPVLYAGDDVTDERAFAALEDGDVRVKVGAGDTIAEHRVPNPDSVALVLDRITQLRKG